MSGARHTNRLPSEDLTAREVETLQRICEGKTNREIAGEFGRAERTVKAHVRSIFAKAGVTSRTQAMRWAIQHGHYIVPPIESPPSSVAQRERTEAAGLQPAGGGDR